MLKFFKKTRFFQTKSALKRVFFRLFKKVSLVWLSFGFNADLFEKTFFSYSKRSHILGLFSISQKNNADLFEHFFTKNTKKRQKQRKDKV